MRPAAQRESQTWRRRGLRATSIEGFDAEDPSQVIDLRIGTGEFLASLDHLSTTQRTVVLRRMVDVDYADIAEELHIGVSSARKEFSTAMKRIRAYLEGRTP